MRTQRPALWSRRQLLRSAGLAVGIGAAGVFGRAARAVETESGRSAGKRVGLRNLHTGETLDVEFSRGGEYVPRSLSAIEVLLRDFRNGEQHAIDPRLMDYLYDAAQGLRMEPVFDVISGYRSPQTNERLRESGSGVARHSLHLEGRAIDVRLAGVDCAKLAGCALDLSRGGVGYYRRSDFVHLDTGAFRTWKG